LRAEYVVSPGLLFLFPLPLTSGPSALHTRKGQREAMVGKAHLDYAAPEVPLPLFGLDHAPSVKRLYPIVGKHELQSSLCEASPP